MLQLKIIRLMGIAVSLLLSQTIVAFLFFCVIFNHIITRISIQTDGLAFGGTDLCTYRVRGVDGSCAEHLTVEYYTVFICQQSHLLLLGIPSPTNFHSRLKTFLFCKSFPPQPFLFLLQDSLYTDSPDCLQLFLSISVFYI